MRDYVKPFIEDEEVEIEDICSMSNKGVADSYDYETDADDFFSE